MENKDINIKSYDGTDAYYEGTDKDYEDFLKSVDGNINTEASPVSDEAGAGVSGETINIRSVLDKVKQKAAKLVNDFKTAQTADEESVPQEEIVFDEADDDVEIIKENITLGTKSAKEHIKNISESAKQKLDGIMSAPSDLTDKIDKMASKLNEIEVKQIEAKSDMDINIKDIGTRLDTLTAEVSDVHQSVTLVSKLNDRMFEIKNAQQNMKKDFEDLETAITTLKKKQVTTATVMSLLSIVIIVLEIVNLLS
ncbi:MAG: hypothetical protein IJT23_02320 [Clostridia bacterium]|nr:hypothetical protein [Clostridia bacterium]